MPEPFWLQEIQISAFNPNDSDKNNKENKSSEKSMLIKGRVILDLENKSPDKIRQFQNEIKKNRPFSLAQSDLDLSDMKIGKLADRYYHDFTIQFTWPE